jgi:hypothetical protein
MIEFPLCPTQLVGGIITDVNADTLWVKFPNGRIAIVKINGDEFEATYLRESE